MVDPGRRGGVLRYRSEHRAHPEGRTTRLHTSAVTRVQGDGFAVRAGVERDRRASWGPDRCQSIDKRFRPCCTVDVDTAAWVGETTVGATPAMS